MCTGDKHRIADAFIQLLDIMKTLRSACPWDRQQSMESLRHLTIEEAFELSEAILEKHTEDIKKELGDLLMHIVFYAQIAEEQHYFTLHDVIQSLCKKLIHRHPHVYSQAKATTVQAVQENWEKQKLKEKESGSVLDGVPSTLPSLVKAMRIQEKVSRINGDWKDHKAVWQQIQQAIHVLEPPANHHTITSLRQNKIQEALGALFFSLVHYARLMGSNPDEALERANKRFMQKFKRTTHYTQQ